LLNGERFGRFHEACSNPRNGQDCGKPMKNGR
jgi:hypothetical protein